MEILTPIDAQGSTGNIPKTVVHGSNASVARPANTGQVFWIGSVEPTNKVTSDVWFNPEASSGQPTFDLAPIMAASRIQVVGHSFAAGGGSYITDRKWSNILAAMLRSEDRNSGMGGAMLGWHNSYPSLWRYSPYPVTHAVGDGGWAHFLQMYPVTTRGIFWKGVYSSGTTYMPGDGVYTTGPTRFWRAKGSATFSAQNPTSAPTYWEEITAGSAYTHNSYEPMPGLNIIYYGLNDLGWGKELAKFISYLDVVAARLRAGMVFEDNDPMISYTGTWANYDFTQANSGTSLRQTTGLVVNNTMTCQVPADWPGGKIRVGFVQNPSQTLSGAFQITVDGVDTKAVDCSTGRGYTGQTTKLVPWVEYVDVSAGAHTVGLRVSTAFPGATSGTYFDYVSFDAPEPNPWIFPRIHKPLTYSAYTEPLPTDSDVDTWNTAIQSHLSTNWPEAQWCDTSALDGVSAYHASDQLHLNDRGQAVLANAMYDTIQSMTVTDRQVGNITLEPRVGNTVTAKFGDQASGGNQIIPNTGVWTMLIVNSRNVRASIGVQPFDVIEVTLDAQWSNNNGGIGYADFSTTEPYGDGTTTQKITWFSSLGSTALNNGLGGCIANASVYAPMAPGTFFYVVQPGDIRNGQVHIQAWGKVSGGTGGRTVLSASNLALDFTVANRGAVDHMAIRFAG